MQLDTGRYRHFVEDLDLTDEEKVKLVADVYRAMEMIVAHHIAHGAVDGSDLGAPEPGLPVLKSTNSLIETYKHAAE